MSDWWAKKLGSEQPPRYGLTVQPQPVQTQTIAYPTQVANIPVRQGERQEVLDPNRSRDEKVGMGDAMRLWRGGEAHRAEGNLSCPNCGSGTGYTTYSGMGAAGARINGQLPRPHCFECGFSGGYMQGLQSNWAS